MDTEADPQRSAFLSGEGDAWFRRNPLDMDHHTDDPWNRHLAEMISEGDRVLEIGCADGRRLEAIRVISARTGAFCGVEPSCEAVAAGRELFNQLELRVGTADATGLSESCDLILFGFCLCWCARASIFPAVAEADRLLRDGGTLAIMDFDPPIPIKRRYHHLEGLWTYKMNYSALFLASPSYSLVEKLSRPTSPASNSPTASQPGDWASLWILRKSESSAYQELT
jgi:SAM-dependent methyltransferase